MSSNDEKQTPNEKYKRIHFSWNLTFQLLTLVAGVVILVKIATSPISLNLTNISFNDILALILALFSVGLSVAFYFKANDTSNTFYDNTYKFTKDISQILGRIEGDFGERLRHLDNGYNVVVGKMMDPSSAKARAEEAEENVEDEEEKVKQQEEARKEILMPVVEKAKLEAGEREELFKKLREKDEELVHAKEQLHYVRSRLDDARAEVNSATARVAHYGSVMLRYIRRRLFPALGGSALADMPIETIRRRFNQKMITAPAQFRKDLLATGLINEAFEPSGELIEMLRDMANKPQ